MTQFAPNNWRKPFFTIWIGQAFSLLGSQLVQFALVWHLTSTTGSATVLATATLLALLPTIVLGPFAGALVDRWDRRLVMMVADGGVALASVGLAVLYMLGVMQPWHIYVAMFLRAVGGTFQWPAMQASTSLMVPKEQLTRVAGMNQTLNGAANIIAPPIGAFLVGVLPLHGIMAIDVLTALLAIVPLTFVRIPQPERAGAAAAPTNVWQDTVAGLRYVWRWPGLLLVMTMGAVINLLLAPAFTLLPLLATKHFGGGAWHVGAFDSAWGIGAVVGGLTLSAWGGFKRRMLTTMAGLIGMGLGTVLVGLLPSGLFVVAVAALFWLGITNPLVDGPLMATVQATVAPDMQARVMSLLISVCKVAAPLGMAVAGPVADGLGIGSWFIAAGVVCLGMGLAGFFVPAVAQLGEAASMPKDAAQSS